MIKNIKKNIKKIIKDVDKKILIRYVFIIIVTVLITISLTGSKQTVINNPQITDERLSDERIAEVLEKLSNNILLPNEESPLVAIITDVVTLQQDQLFYKDASNGDYLIVFPENSKAMIYNAEKDLIINVGPLEIANTQTSDSTDNIPAESSEENFDNVNIIEDENIPVEIIEYTDTPDEDEIIQPEN